MFANSKTVVIIIETHFLSRFWFFFFLSPELTPAENAKHGFPIFLFAITTNFSYTLPPIGIGRLIHIIVIIQVISSYILMVYFILNLFFFSTTIRWCLYWKWCKLNSHSLGWDEKSKASNYSSQPNVTPL